MSILRQLVAISVLGWAGALLLVFIGACGPRDYYRNRALLDILNREKVRDSQDQRRLQKERQAVAEELNSRAAAFEAQARQDRAKGLSESAEQSEREARKLRDEALKAKRGVPPR